MFGSSTQRCVFLIPEKLLQSFLRLVDGEHRALHNAIAMLTQRVQLMAEQGNQRGGGGGGTITITSRTSRSSAEFRGGVCREDIGRDVPLSSCAGEANAFVRRSLGSVWLAWKRLFSSLNPNTLASGIKSVSTALNPQRITTRTNS